MTADCEIVGDSACPPMAISWRDAAFYEDVVAKDLNLPPGESFKILTASVANATAKTAGFMSLMHRVTVTVEQEPDGDRKELNYVVKEQSEEAFGGEWVEKMKAFPKEIEMYSNILPSFEELWKDEGVKFGPRVFKVTTSPFTVIVMEDLKQSGFVMKDCSVGLSLEESEKVLEKLAKFHAASVKNKELHGPYDDNFKDGMFSDSMIDGMEEYYGPILDSYIEALEEQQYSAEIIDRIKLLKGKIYTTVCKLFQFNPARFNVLNHGDCWVNNLQFSDYELLLLDYQISFYGSPAFDVLYNITNSASLESRTDKFDHLVDHYHRHLTAGLRKLEAETAPPTRQELIDDIQAHGCLMLILSLEALPMMLSLPDIEMDMELLGSTEPEGHEYRRKFLTNPRYVEALKKLMPFMWERGFLNVE